LIEKITTVYSIVSKTATENLLVQDLGASCDRIVPELGLPIRQEPSARGGRVRSGAVFQDHNLEVTVVARFAIFKL
jgi:hypothetical protein